VYKNIEDRDEKNYSMAGLVPGYGDGVQVLDRSVASDRSHGASLDLTYPLGDHEILAGIDHQVLAYGDITINSIDSTYNNYHWFGPRPQSHHDSSEGVLWGYYGRDSWRLGDRLLLTAGLRYDTYENKAINGSTAPELKDEQLSPKLTVTYGPGERDRITVSLYQAMRAPGIPETYWWANGATGGKPRLRAEKNRAAELVFRHGLASRGFLRLSAYYYDIDDYLMFRFDPNWRGAYNIDRAVLSGGSLDGRLGLTDRLTLRGSLGYQKSRKHGDIYDSAHLTDEIDYLPEWQAGLGVDLRLPLAMTLAADIHYVGERKAIYAWKGSGWPAKTHFRLETLGAYSTVDLDLKVPLTKHGELGLFVENLFDKGYEERFGYPMPGRVAGLSFKAGF
jgi:iron complex outermembrane receptor protein